MAPPRPAAGDQGLARHPKHEVELPIGSTVKIFKMSRSQSAPRGVLIPTINKRVSNERAPLTKQRSLPLELQADIAV